MTSFTDLTGSDLIPRFLIVENRGEWTIIRLYPIGEHNGKENNWLY